MFLSFHRVTGIFSIILLVHCIGPLVRWSDGTVFAEVDAVFVCRDIFYQKSSEEMISDKKRLNGKS